MKKNPSRFWLIVILLGWAFDFLFWEKPAGVNFFLYVILLLGVGIYLLQTDGLRLSRRAGWILLPILFLAFMTFVRLEGFTVFLSVAMTVFLLGVFALTYTGGNWVRYGIADYILGYLTLLGSMIARPLGFAAEVRRDQPEMGQKRNVWPILRGIVIALPVIAVFASLLSSADVIFAKRFEEFTDLFNIENLPEYIFRLVYILAFAYAIAGTYLHAAQKSNDTVDESKPRLPAFLGFTEAAIVLGSVVVLFAAFVVIQFQYFFGGQANITIEGFTYSEYARRGFGELVAVAFFSLLMLLGLGGVTKRETDSQRRAFSTLGIVLVGLVLVMQVSAFQRLVLYEDAYGFSRLRTYTHMFMIWLAILLVAVAVLELLRRERAIAFSILLVSVGFVASLSLLNVDAFIVRQNIQREVRGQVEDIINDERVLLDTSYFTNLSYDAIPSLVDGFRNKALPESIREELGAALVCQRYDRENEEDFPWQGFHLSRYFADQAFASVGQSLSAYELAADDFPIMVITPSGTEFSCSGYIFD
jgi:hypothetical protein